MQKFERAGAKLTLHPDAPPWRGKAMAVSNLKFESVADGVALLDEVAAFAKSEGSVALLGPMQGDTWHDYRLTIYSNGRDPILMEPTQGPHDWGALTAAGFESIAEYFSAEVSLNSIDLSPPPPPSDLVFTTWDGNDPEALFSEVHELCVTAFSKNLFFKPIDQATFLAKYMPLVPLIKRELITFARDHSGALQGFLFGIPNYAEGPAPKAAILKSYASLVHGAGRTLGNRFYRAAADLGHTSAIHALIYDDNVSADRSKADGAEIFRRYALLGRRLDD